MSAVLDFFRQQEPRFQQVPDADLAKYIGDNHPEFLRDPEFNAQYGGSMTPVAPVAPSLTSASGAAVRQLDEQFAEGQRRHALQQADERQHQIAEAYDAHPIAQVLKPVGRSGKVALAGTADLAHLMRGEAPQELSAFAQNPDQPLPIEELIQETRGAGRVSAVVGSTGAKLLPVFGQSVMLGAAGASSAVAAGLPMGVTEEGGFDPVGAAIAAGLPGVTRWGERTVAAGLSRLPTSKVVIEVLSKDPLRLKGKVVQKLGNLEISNDAFRKYLEVGGGALAANAYLLAAQAPTILALPADQRAEAILDAVAGNLAPSVLGFVSRRGPSATLEGMFPKLAQEWANANQPLPRRPLGQPAEEGAPVPEPGPIGYNPFPEKPATVQTPGPAPVPAPPTTVQAQLALALDPNSSRTAVHITPGEEMPSELPPGLVARPLQNGLGTLLVNPAKADPDAAALAANQEAHGQFLGFGNATKPEGGEHVLQTRNAAGVVVQDELVTPETTPAALEAAKRAVPGGTSEIITAWDAIKGRKPTGENPGNLLANEVALQLRQGLAVDRNTVRIMGGNLGLDDRQSGEWAELGATEVAREIARSEMSNADKFHALVRLYDRMPVNGDRTTETRVNQQYSTPPPLAFVAGLLADIHGGGFVYEPTAGHGMLTIGANPNAVLLLNELHNLRRQRLERYAKGFKLASVTSNDAAGEGWAKALAVNPPDRVVQNPPFGNVLDEQGNSKDFPILNAATKAKTTKSIDIAIALNSFEALPPHGKGYAIIGAKTGTAHNGMNPDPKARAEAYRRADLIEFFQRFHVVDWFTVSGELYRRMGAGWPVDVIVVHGKGKTPRPENGGLVPPWVKPPRVIETWAELERLIPNANEIISGGSGKPPQSPGPGGGGKLPQPGPGSGAGAGSPPAPPPGTQPKPPTVGGQPPGAAPRPGPAGRPGSGGGGRPGGGPGPGPAPGPTPPVGGGGPQLPPPGPPGLGGKGPGTPGPVPPPKLSPKVDDILKKLRDKLGGSQPQPMAAPANRLDPEAMALAGQLAEAYAEQGVQKFSAFANQVLNDAPDLWPMLKPYLHGAWNSAAVAYPQLEEITRSDAAKVIDNLENQPSAPAPPPPPPNPREENLSLLVPYRPVSKNTDPKLMVPRNIGNAILTALIELEREVGMSVDEFVAGRLDMDIPKLYKALSAPQIDAAALAFRNVERRSALINANQTGVGKGRVVGGLIEYALRHDLIPVFVSANKQLYTDMAARDLVALGNTDFRPFITDNQHYYVDGRGREHNVKRSAAEFRAMVERMAATGELPEKAQGIFTTYFQLTKDKPQGFTETEQQKARRKRNKDLLPDGPLWAALRRLGPRLLLILDEAHLAAGETSDVGTRLASLIPNAAGVYYSSATFAKRPDNLNLYAMGTLMNRSGLDYAAMTELLKQGGVPLQQALTAMLAESGEFIRQELDWTGTPIVFKQTSANPEREVQLADDYTSFLRDLNQLAKQINAAAAGIVDTVNGQRPDELQVDVSNISFGSRLFNLSNQYLLALRAAAVVREAVAELKVGRKPFITVYNTMEGPLQDLRQRRLPLSFNGLLLREMQKMLTITIRDPMEQTGKRQVTLTPEQLPDGGAFYRQLEQQVMVYDFAGMPISPLDEIKRGIQEAKDPATGRNYSIGELSGRSGTVDETGNEVVITKREDTERQKVLKQFNDGGLDALIGNATTGFSAHAAPEFKDQRPRTQITAQAAPDINSQMQIFGRNFRFGQTSLPKYIILSTALAAERRFAVMLRGKMASLNANTSADTESGWTGQAGFSADVFNVVGDEVVFNVMRANDTAAHLAEIRVPNEAEDGFARYATGRFVLLPNEDAQRLWDQIVSQYEDTIRILDETGENPLRAQAEDLRARTLEQSELVPGTGNTPFDGPAILERAEVTPPKAPMTHAEARQQAAENRAKVREQWSAWQQGSQRAEQERLTAAQQRGATPEQIARIRENFQNVRDRIMVAFRTLGDTYGVDPMGTGEISFHGMPMDLRLKGEDVSDFASASRQQLIIATNTYKRKFTVPLSKFEEGMLQAVDEDEAAGVFDGNAETNTERYIITGNLLAGFEASQGMTMGQEMGKPRVAIYTTHDGGTRTGILMPPRWTPTTTGGAGEQRPITSPEAFANAVANDYDVRSTAQSSYPVRIQHGQMSVPANASGRGLWASPGYNSFFTATPRQAGGQFVGELKGDTLPRLFQFLTAAGVRLSVHLPGNTSQSMRGGGRERTSSSRGLHVKGFSQKPGTVSPAVQLGGMQYVRALEMPELVRLARELLGGDIKLRKPRGKAVAFFAASGGRGFIQMDPALFKNSMEAVQVMAHEIGHAYDWFDDKTGTPRGNLWGHLRALNMYLRQKFGRSNVTSRELKAELIKLTEWWRPWDRSTAPKSFTDYRESPEELYADAMSVLFNAPSELQSRAPLFYKAFWDAIDARPEARDALLEIQNLLGMGKYAVAAKREAGITDAFAKGEAAWKAAVAERLRVAKSWDGWWTRLAQELYWNFYPLEQRARELERGGTRLPFEKDPRVFLDDLGFRDVPVMRWGRTMFEKVIQPIEDAGMTLEDAGKWLLYNRILEGDRQGLANPGGLDPKAARLGLLKLNLDLGLPQMTLLRAALDRFHEEIFKLAEQAVEVGAYNKTTFETVIKPNRGTYATFAVLDYVDDYIPPGIKQQIGTLKDVANPFHATILKSIGLLNLIAYQQAKNKTVEFLQQYYPADLERAGEAHPTARKGKGIFMRLENGRPAHYYTDPYIADAFDKLNPRQLWWLARAADGLFRKFVYPLIITYNPAFLYIMSPLRDVQRTARNLPGAVPPVRLGADYLRNLIQTLRRFQGDAGPLIREMEANLALGTPFDLLQRGHRDDFLADLLKRMRVLPDHELQGWFASNVWKPIRFLLDRLELGGMTLDTLAKTASYQHLRRGGASPRMAAMHVRNFSGLPNINKRGLIVRQLRALVPFWNVAMQGWRADIGRATDPTTAAGWWFKYVATNGFLRALLALAATGALGVALKELFDGIGENDKTNYLSVPIGTVPGGEYGQRTAYLRIPEDETARLLGGLISKGIRQLGPDSPDLAGIFDFGMGQIPSVNPAVSVPAKWAEFAAGHSPRDPFTGRDIVPDLNWKAGGWDSVQPMAAWTLNQSGVMNFFRYNPDFQSGWELALSATPGVNKFIKVSDQGKREQQRARETAEDQRRAQEKLKLPAEALSLSLEYGRLNSLKAEQRTPQQRERLTELSLWHKYYYLPAWEGLERAHEEGSATEADSIRRQLGRDSVAFQRRR